MFRWKIAAGAGAAAALLIATVAMVAETGDIQRDVAARAAEALAGEATEWASIEVDGRDVALAGAAPAEDLRRLAATRVDRVFGVRTVDDAATTLLPEQAPYRVALLRDGDTVSVTGHAPSAPEKARMIDRIGAALPGLQVEDRLDLARGMPDRRFLDVLDALAPAVSDLSAGTVSLEDRTARIEGIAASNPAFEGLQAWSPALPADYALLRPDVVRPVASPFAVHAVLEEGRVTLSGYAPDAESRQRFIDTAQLAREAEVTEAVDLASGDPPGFVATAVAALDFLDLFATARIDVVDRRISLVGVAATPEAWRTLTSHLATFSPAGFVVESDVGLPVVSPFTLSATISGGKVTVTGFVPDAASVEEIRRAAELVADPGGALVETTLAAGAPERFADAAAFAVRLLEHVEDGTVTLADSRVSLAGRAPTSGDLLEIEAAIALETPEGFEVETSVQPPVVSPYVWAIERTEDSVVITGHVPSEAVRVAVRDAADDAIGDLAVTDRTGLAGGLPEGIDLAAVAAFAAGEVALLDEGRVELVDRVLSVTGRTADALAGRSARESFEIRLPAGVERGTVAIEAPSPFRFVVEREPGILVVEGSVPDRAAQDRLFALVERLYGSVELEVSLDPVAGLPEGAEAVAATALRAAALLKSGRVDVSGARLSVSGEALTRPAAALIETDLLDDLPAGFAADAAVRPPEAGEVLDADACDARLSEVTRRVRPSFGDGGALLPDGEGAVAEIAAVALACRGLTLEVVAGGAGRGDAAARADALAARLVEAGVAPDRILAAVDPVAEGIAVNVVRDPAEAPPPPAAPAEPQTPAEDAAPAPPPAENRSPEPPLRLDIEPPPLDLSPPGDEPGGLGGPTDL